MAMTHFQVQVLRVSAGCNLISRVEKLSVAKIKILRIAVLVYRAYIVIQEVKVISPYVNGLAGYSERDCAAGVLLWNVPVPKNGRPQEEETLSVALHSLPFAKFDVEAYILDDRKQPWVRSPTQNDTIMPFIQLLPILTALKGFKLMLYKIAKQGSLTCCK